MDLAKAMNWAELQSRQSVIDNATVSARYQT